MAKARTPTSAPGSSAQAGRRRASGFTLVELLVVLVLVALASGLAGLALRQGEEASLEREAARLVALLESARAESRATGVPVRFELGGGEGSDAAFRFTGLPAGGQVPPSRWLDPATTARIDSGRALVLGPEPLIGRQRIVLSMGERQLALDTDGLAPFAVSNQTANP